MTTTMSIRLNQELKDRLERLAQATNRSRSFLTVEALKQFIELNEWQVTVIQEGIAAADAGRLVEHEQAEAWLTTWGNEGETEPPK
jgi:predicted transcriptional regulator